MINSDKVSAVLLADGWHAVERGTFTDGASWWEGDREDPSGFRFKESGGVGGQLVRGPLTAILAVRTLG